MSSGVATLAYLESWLGIFVTQDHSEAILPPPASDSLPTFFLVQATLVLQAHSSFNPLLAAHLAQPTERSGEGKALFVAGKQTAIFQHLHVHSEIIHHLPHHIIDPFVIFRVLYGSFLAPMLLGIIKLGR